jgi:hypothetical protein
LFNPWLIGYRPLISFAGALYFTLLGGPAIPSTGLKSLDTKMTELQIPELKSSLKTLQEQIEAFQKSINIPANGSQPSDPVVLEPNLKNLNQLDQMLRYNRSPSTRSAKTPRTKGYTF